MTQSYDFSEGSRGRVAAPEPEPRGKTRITIRLDEDLVDHFLKEAEASGGNFETLVNEALRRVLREEMRAESRVVNSMPGASS
jgi:uncharacterized protein (DUF4415 family)